MVEAEPRARREEEARQARRVALEEDHREEDHREEEEEEEEGGSYRPPFLEPVRSASVAYPPRSRLSPAVLGRGSSV